MLDAVSSGLDAVSGALGGAAPGGPAAPAPMTFTKGERLGGNTDASPGYQSPNELRPRDGGAPIEFIHMGYAHPDSSFNFNHASLKDDVNLEVTPGSTTHGIMFRAALEREAVCLADAVVAEDITDRVECGPRGVPRPDRTDWQGGGRGAG